MKINMKKFLLAGTAIVAVSTLAPARAHAQHVLTGAGTWASGATQTSADDGAATNAAASDTVDVDTNTLTITNDGVANDGSGLNSFSTGAITDTDTGAAGTGGVTIVSGAANNLAATIASASVAGNVDISNADGNDATVTATFTGALTVGGTFDVTNTETDTVDDVSVSVGGVLTVTGAATVTAGGFAGANSTLTLSDDATFTAGLLMDDDVGSVTVTFDGAALQTVTGDIDGVGAGEGNIIVDNTAGVVFVNDIGITTNAIDTFTLNAGSVTEIQGDFMAVNLVFGGAGATFESSGAGTLSANVTGSSGIDTIDLTGGETFGLVGDDIDMGGGNDVINVSGGATTIGADTLAGGAGAADTINVDDDLEIAGVVTGFEAFNVGDSFALLFDDDVTGGTVTLGDGSSLEVDGGTVTSTVASDASGADAQTFALTSGTMSGNVSLGAGIDAVILTSGAMSGDIDLGTGADTLALDGSTVAGDIDGGTGTDTATLGANFTTAGTIANIELIDVNGNTLTVESAITGGGATYGVSGIDVAGGTLELNNGGSFAGSIFDTGVGGLLDVGADAGGGTFTLGGEIDDVDLTITSGTLRTNGYTLGGNGSLGVLTNAGTMYIEGGDTVTAATQADWGGTFSFEVDSTAATGLLTITGGAFDMTTSTITAVVGTGNIANGDEILIVDGSATIVGGPGGVATAITESSFLWDFNIIDGTGVVAATDDTDLFLQVAVANTISGAATTAGNLAAGNVLTSLGAAGNTQIDLVLAELNASASATEVNEVLEAVQPTVDGGGFAGSLNVMSNTMDITDIRLAALRSGKETGMAAGNISRGISMWSQGFGQSAKQDLRDNIDGYDSDTYGVAVGIDTETLNSGTVGVAFSYGNTQVESENANRTNTDVDSYQVTVYGDYDLSKQSYINGMVAYGRSTSDTTRHNVGGVSGLTASGSYDTDLYTVRGEVGRDYAYGGMTLTPNVMGHWTHFSPDSYTETGAGGANLSVDMDSMDIAELGVGLDASWLLKQNNGAMMEPGIGIGYRYDFIGDKVEATSNFVAGGAAFASQGPDPAQGTLDVGASLKYYTTDNWELTINYDFEYKEDYDAHSAYVRAAYNF